MPRSFFQTCMLEAKSVARSLLGIPDPWKQFRRFEGRIHPQTWSRQEELLAASTRAPAADADPGRFGDALAVRAEILEGFRDRWRSAADRWRVLIHLPSFAVTAAGHSLFRNLGAGLAWVGIPVGYWPAGTPVAPHLRDFRPSVLLSIDHIWYSLHADPAGRDTADVREYQRAGRLVLGLSSNHGPADAGVVDRQLTLARELGAGFFYSFQCPAFVARGYTRFAAHGFPVLSLEFGANPLVYHPLPGVARDIGYVFVASSNAEKWDRYFEYLTRPLARHPGLIVGPGWTWAAASTLPDEQINRLYARARVGLNLHVPFQIADATELNERAYNLAAAGVPQLTDRPALLPAKFSEGAVFSAGTPDRYAELFEYMLAHPEESADRGIRSMQEVLASDTIFHRADALLRLLDGRFG